jgi:hypothetical protein
MRRSSVKSQCPQLYIWALALALPIILSLILVSRANAATGPKTTGRGAELHHERSCRQVRFTGEVARGQEWKAGLGQGWVFRLVPIGKGSSLASGTGSGWDLTVSPERDENYPDALLLATPPYESLNEREIGTTFGLRAQDAIAWEPRHFHFLIAKKDLNRARTLFHAVNVAPVAGKGIPGVQPDAAAELLKMIADPARAASGKLAITDAQLVAGVADPPPFARQWATRLSLVPHTLKSGSPTPQGELYQIRFTVTLWLPEEWRTPKEVGSERANCPE